MCGTKNYDRISPENVLKILDRQIERKQDMGIFDVFVAVVLGIVEGITEWLPISSTGHMILVNQFLNFTNKDFSEMFLVVVQLLSLIHI